MTNEKMDEKAQEIYADQINELARQRYEAGAKIGDIIGPLLNPIQIVFAMQHSTPVEAAAAFRKFMSAVAEAGARDIVGAARAINQIGVG